MPSSARPTRASAANCGPGSRPSASSAWPSTGAKWSRRRRTSTSTASIPGLRTLDRYTLRFEVDKPQPRLLESLASSDLLGGVAREVVEFYGDNIGAHPVGTGPFRLKSWRRSSQIVLERSPHYREVLYDAEPAADDAEGQAILARMKGRRLPMIDEVRVSIIQEDQPRWLIVPQRPDRHHRVELRSRAGELHHHGDAQRQGGAQPRAPGHSRCAAGRLHGFLQLLQHGGPGGRRLYARQGGAAPRHRRWPSTCHARSRSSCAARRSRRSRASCRTPSGYDPTFKSEASDYDPARATRPARRVRLCRPRR